MVRGEGEESCQTPKARPHGRAFAVRRDVERGGRAQQQKQAQKGVLLLFGAMWRGNVPNSKNTPKRACFWRSPRRGGEKACRTAQARHCGRVCDVWRMRGGSNPRNTSPGRVSWVWKGWGHTEHEKRASWRVFHVRRHRGVKRGGAVASVGPGFFTDEHNQ